MFRFAVFPRMLRLMWIVTLLLSLLGVPGQPVRVAYAAANVSQFSAWTMGAVGPTAVRAARLNVGPATAEVGWLLLLGVMAGIGGVALLASRPRRPRS